MNRRWFAALLIGTGRSAARWPRPRALRKTRRTRSRSPAPRAIRTTARTTQKIDKTIQAYQNRSVQDLEQTRKDLDRMRKELRELVEVRFDMAIAAAELVRNGEHWAFPGPSPPPPVTRAPPGSRPRCPREGPADSGCGRDEPGTPAGPGNPPHGDPAVRNQTDQLVAQLRELRAEQRQRQEQTKAEQERNKERENKDQAGKHAEKK